MRVLLIILILSLAGCTKPEEETCQRVTVTLCSKFEQGRLVDSYESDDTCRFGYVRSVDTACR